MTSGPPQQNDAETIAAILKGDREQFSDLVQRYQGRLVNYLYRLLRSTEEAQDLAQEVFVKIYLALDRYDPRYKFSTWLFRVAQNTWEFPSPDPSPYRNMRNRERGEAIQEVIDQLPWEYRELIVLRHYGELSYDEIASLKKMPLGTVKNKLFRGRQMMKEKLQDYLSD
jgi:RNA polymerase sigma-70 factor (ECF subfamily)